MEQTFIEKIAEVQSELKAPKDKTASVKTKTGVNYSYKFRNAETILADVKPLLRIHSLIITLDDELIENAGRLFIKSTATISDGRDSITSNAIAELLVASQMNEPQATGATTSYARKYALCGVLGIDDGDDADDEKYAPLSPTTKKTYPQHVENNVDNVDPETFKNLCFVGKNLGLEAEQIKKVWNYAWEIGRYTRGKWNPDTKEWTGTNIPTDALRPILTAFAKEAGQDPNVLLAQFGIDALSDIKSVDDYSDEPF
jgi:hypothetical protein